MKNWRTSKEYRRWRIHVIRRDKACVICGSAQKRRAHHIHDASNYVAARFDENNGVCLCQECHTQFHCNYKKSYRQTCNMDDFLNFRALMVYGMTLVFTIIDAENKE